MQECYLTAVIIMDSKGNLIAQEYTDEYGADELNEYLDSTSLIDVVDNTEKTYAIKLTVKMVHMLTLQHVVWRIQVG